MVAYIKLIIPISPFYHQMQSICLTIQNNLFDTGHQLRYIALQCLMKNKCEDIDEVGKINKYGICASRQYNAG